MGNEASTEASSVEELSDDDVAKPSNLKEYEEQLLEAHDSQDDLDSASARSDESRSQSSDSYDSYDSYDSSYDSYDSDSSEVIEEEYIYQPQPKPKVTKKEEVIDDDIFKPGDFAWLYDIPKLLDEDEDELLLQEESPVKEQLQEPLENKKPVPEASTPEPKKAKPVAKKITLNADVVKKATPRLPARKSSTSSETTGSPQEYLKQNILGILPKPARAPEPVAAVAEDRDDEEELESETSDVEEAADETAIDSESVITRFWSNVRSGVSSITDSFKGGSGGEATPAESSAPLQRLNVSILNNYLKDSLKVQNRYHFVELSEVSVEAFRSHSNNLKAVCLQVPTNAIQYGERDTTEAKLRDFKISNGLNSVSVACLNATMNAFDAPEVMTKLSPVYEPLSKLQNASSEQRSAVVVGNVGNCTMADGYVLTTFVMSQEHAKPRILELDGQSVVPHSATSKENFAADVVKVIKQVYSKAEVHAFMLIDNGEVVIQDTSLAERDHLNSTLSALATVPGEFCLQGDAKTEQELDVLYDTCAAVVLSMPITAWEKIWSNPEDREDVANSDLADRMFFVPHHANTSPKYVAILHSLVNMYRDLSVIKDTKVARLVKDCIDLPPKVRSLNFSQSLAFKEASGNTGRHYVAFIRAKESATAKEKIVQLDSRLDGPVTIYHNSKKGKRQFVFDVQDYVCHEFLENPDVPLTTEESEQFYLFHLCQPLQNPSATDAFPLVQIVPPGVQQKSLELIKQEQEKAQQEQQNLEAIESQQAAEMKERQRLKEEEERIALEKRERELAEEALAQKLKREKEDAAEMEKIKQEQAALALEKEALEREQAAADLLAAKPVEPIKPVETKSADTEANDKEREQAALLKEEETRKKNEELEAFRKAVEEKEKAEAAQLALVEAEEKAKREAEAKERSENSAALKKEEERKIKEQTKMLTLASDGAETKKEIEKIARQIQAEKLKKSESKTLTTEKKREVGTRPFDTNSINAYFHTVLNLPNGIKALGEFRVGDVMSKVKDPRSVFGVIVQYPAAVQKERHAFVSTSTVTIDDCYYSVPVPENDRGLSCATACVNAVMNNDGSIDLGRSILHEIIADVSWNTSKESVAVETSKSSVVFPKVIKDFKQSMYVFTCMLCIHDDDKYCLYEIDSSLGNNQAILHKTTKPAKFLADVVETVRADHCTNYSMQDVDIRLYPLAS